MQIARPKTQCDAGELVTVPIEHALFRNTHARVLVRSGRPLVAAAQALLDCIVDGMAMFAAPPAQAQMKPTKAPLKR